MPPSTAFARGRKKCNCLTPTHLTPLILVVAILGAIVVGFMLFNAFLAPPDTITTHTESHDTSYYPVVVSPNIPYSNATIGAYGYGTGVLANPIVPPVKDSRYLVGALGSRLGLNNSLDPRPIATASDAVISEYRQVGMLTPQNGTKKDNLLPLMGRPLFARRGLWNYYAISNQNNAIKLPVTVKGKSGVGEYGVDEVFNGDTVYVEGYDDVFRVTMYSNASIQYVPF